MSSASSASLFDTLPVTKQKVKSVITRLKNDLKRDPTEDEIARALNISVIDLQPFIKQSSPETRYYGSSLTQYNKPPGSIYNDQLRYERLGGGGPIYNGGRSKTNSNKNKKKHKKVSRRHIYRKKNRKSMKRK